MPTFDYIVVGSGCSGAIAAQTLLNAGKQVAMLDVGETNPDYQSTVPNDDFLGLRQHDPQQYKYLIGENAQGVVVNDTGKGAQITPPRTHMLRNIDKYIPLKSDTFEPIESLGYGGLGISWGLQCWEFSRKEISSVGLDVERTIRAYETVARHVGISGTNDDASHYTVGELTTYQPSPDMDQNMQRIYKNYQRNHTYFERARIRMGRTPLALITKDTDDRDKYAYRDMDFYDDNQRSAWRPWIMVDMLRQKKALRYIGNFLALRFSETDGLTTIHGIDTKTKELTAYSCRRLILATGALGSARIALRSFDAAPSYQLPFLCNPYTYVPCVQPAMLGSGAERRKIGFGQLSAFLEDEEDYDDSSILTLYSYQSLMLFRVVRQVPLNFSDARPIMQYLSPALVVTGIQHSDKHTPDKYLQLHKNRTSLTHDELRATYRLSTEEITGQRIREDRYIKSLRRTGLYAVRRMNPGHGSSVHYAGTLPFSATDELFHTDATGRLYGTRGVYVADSSAFKFLPARGLTFTILANAQLTAENVLQS